ncbi:MAG: N-acetylmuramoyl-L-alanine amidase [Nitriliruptoraceae bacterium]|nr:N-acetylmuramoyl-L-alanine amidase [Nitriliruptoraceae bacterium]
MELIRRGSAGPEVADVQGRLRELGIPVVDQPGVFELGTEASVRAFQQQRGLPADGIVGPETWATLVGASYRLGDRILYVTSPALTGDDVRDLQGRLSRLGFDVGYDDGIYGPQTVDAVREFQLNVGITTDGIAGPSTVDQLRRLHRQHQSSPAYVVQEREALRRPHRLAVAGARILLDPGHSPQDPGLIAPDGTAEHEVTWRLATLLEGRLSALGAHVLLSRGPTTSPTPSERASQANAAGVEVVLSIHANGAPSDRAVGAAAYYFGHGELRSERGRTLAEMALDAVVAATGTPDCRTHAATTAILRETRAPAVVVEPGFLTHPTQGRELTEPDHQHLIAGALTDALANFLVGATPAAHAS